MFWLLKDPARLDLERAAIAALDDSSEWLSVVDWTFDNAGRLCVDADIFVGSDRYEVRLAFPKVYPACPPTVTPRCDGERWSAHQYGPGGELCLEWGPDTWVPSCTGADCLTSAHKLLSSERGEIDGRPAVPVPSRHALTTGQSLRREILRFALDAAVREQVRSLPVGQHELKLRIAHSGKAMVAFVSEVVTAEQSWSNPTIPPGFESLSEMGGMVFATDWPELPKKNVTCSDLVANLDASGLNTDGLQTAAGQKPAKPFVLVRTAGGDLRLYWITDVTENKIWPFAGLDISDDGGIRLDPALAQLSEKSVGIVGLGSVGSKIAQSLARTGVRSFVLVDDDLVRPENLCRHTLDWRDVGQHKADAMADALRVIGDVKVDRRCIRISGQEASESVANALAALGKCDVIIDATANPQTFNRLSSVAEQESCPMVWMEVFGGGVGALLGRFRPGADTGPQWIREGVHKFLEEKPKPEFTTGSKYDGVDADGVVVVGSDADVGVVAGYATQLAIDVLTGAEPPQFDHPAYLIGFRREWIFEAPFHAQPIKVARHEPEMSQEDRQGQFHKAAEFIVSVVEGMKDEGAASSDD